MKKVFMTAAVAAMMMVGLSSCYNPDKLQCFEVTITYTVEGESLTSTEYVWTTGNEIDAQLTEIAKKYSNVTGTKYSTMLGLSQEGCEALNEVLGE